jgi:ppGpp synthetase/RelA/SpoT-type nucleotidyltranferase
VTIEDDFERYRSERPLFEQVVNHLMKQARDACRRAGLRCTVSGRAKTLDSFAKKLMNKPQPYEEVYDKAGIRIVPAYPDDRDAIVDVVRATFTVAWEKDFAASVASNVFEYRGIHFTVGFGEGGRQEVPSNLWPLVAELQVHRPGEAVWANVNHDLFYKSRIVADSGVRRAMNRLSALLELVDISMAEIRTQLLHAPGADIARVIDAIEKDFLRLRGVPFNEQLTIAVVQALLPAAGGVDEFQRKYAAFVETNEEKLAHVFSEYQHELRHLLLGQPESILIFYLMDHDRPGLEARWPAQVPLKMLDGLDGVWVSSEAS